MTYALARTVANVGNTALLLLTIYILHLAQLQHRAIGPFDVVEDAEVIVFDVRMRLGPSESFSSSPFLKSARTGVDGLSFDCSHKLFKLLPPTMSKGTIMSGLSQPCLFQ
ncbi:uncharacterized protein B0H64DRAFT_69334 [Chaetomium fimeti]|uniref:Uncharacterized protein n=1 Tax=Chaetomium fimeti TaxID=1854472 RepID=A0AAE0HKJ6_9PEZI|nr:hypothetical protein B0H64DRAFT_69334 [Chaetomium fimeti]